MTAKKGITTRPWSTRSRCLHAIAAAAMLAPAAVNAAPSRTHMWAMMGEEAVIEQSDLDVIVATIARAEDGPRTNADPPHLTIKVTEVLRGDETLIGQHEAVWLPFPHDVDWVGDDASQRIASWQAQPLKGPEERERFLLVGDMDNLNVFQISPIGRFPYSEERRVWGLGLLQ